MTVFRPSNSVWYAIRTSNAHTIMWQFGLPGDLSLAGNFDGDNKTDFAVYRVSTGLWYASSSATGQTIERLYGAPGDVPDPGDYDGDGITDFAVYRPSNWSLKRLLAARAFGAGSSDLLKETAWFTSNPQTPDISQGAVNIAIRYNNSMMPVAGEGREISDSQYRIMSEFRFQIRKFLRFSEDTARQSGLEPQQHQLLLVLKGLPEGTRPTITAISGRMCLRHHTTVELVNRTAERGAVVRSHNGEDRREVLVEITEIGEQLLRRLSDSHWQELKNEGPALAAALDELLAHNGESAEE